MPGQLGHRDQDPLLKSSDSDFPEPAPGPEHRESSSTECGTDTPFDFAQGRLVRRS